MILDKDYLIDLVSIATALFLSLIEQIVRIIISFFIPKSFIEFFRKSGYGCEQHIVVTTDGYYLSIHRITRDNSDGKNNSTNHNDRPVVLLWHGLMMNSEVFVCCPESENNLAFYLYNRGWFYIHKSFQFRYDVWLGNCRGNKYCLKNRNCSPNEKKFWDFSLDQYAEFDLPETIEFRNVPSLSYLGFSQGTAMCYAALSIRPSLDSKINLFISLAPATTPKSMNTHNLIIVELENAFIDGIIRANPNIVYLIFGRKAALTIVYFWQNLLPKNIYVKLIDISNKILFGWNSYNMSYKTKKLAYQHLFSTTSVKTLTHWFQIIKSRRLQFYHDNELISELFYKGKYSHINNYPIHQIKTKLCIFYGLKDNMCDMRLFFRNCPQLSYKKEVPHYEHLDFLWADDTQECVFTDLVQLLNEANK